MVGQRTFSASTQRVGGLREALETLVSERSVSSRAVSEVTLSNEVKIVRGEPEGRKRSGHRLETVSADYGKRWRL